MSNVQQGMSNVQVGASLGTPALKSISYYEFQRAQYLDSGHSLVDIGHSLLDIGHSLSFYMSINHLHFHVVKHKRQHIGGFFDEFGSGLACAMSGAGFDPDQCWIASLLVFL